jgi:hypothetical protein
MVLLVRCGICSMQANCFRASYLCMMASTATLLLLGDILSGEEGVLGGALPVGNTGLLSSTGLIMAAASDGSLVGVWDVGCCAAAELGLCGCNTHSKGSQAGI